MLGVPLGASCVTHTQQGKSLQACHCILQLLPCQLLSPGPLRNLSLEASGLGAGRTKRISPSRTYALNHLRHSTPRAHPHTTNHASHPPCLPAPCLQQR